MASELTTESATELYTKTDPFTYNIATATASQYTLVAFMGIIIDISTSYKSIAGYGQF